MIRCLFLVRISQMTRIKASAEISEICGKKLETLGIWAKPTLSVPLSMQDSIDTGGCFAETDRQTSLDRFQGDCKRKSRVDVARPCDRFHLYILGG